MSSASFEQQLAEALRESARMAREKELSDWAVENDDELPYLELALEQSEYTASVEARNVAVMAALCELTVKLDIERAISEADEHETRTSSISRTVATPIHHPPRARLQATRDEMKRKDELAKARAIAADRRIAYELAKQFQ